MNWEGADIRPQIRPWKISAFICVPLCSMFIFIVFFSARCKRVPPKATFSTDETLHRPSASLL